MYVPPHFRETGAERLRAILERHAFGTLVTTAGGRPAATHLPFLYESERHELVGHLARANPAAEQLARGDEVLVVFTGPHAYVSPTWYASAGVPTWNYTAVHVYGTPAVSHEPGELAALVEQLAARYERGRDSPWRPEYAPDMLRAVTGFRIAITEIEGKFKLSQNRPAEDRAEVVRQLRDDGSDDATGVAEWMERLDPRAR